MKDNKIFVVGSGFMGSGISQIAAVSKYQVTLMDIDESALKRGLASIEWSLDKLIEKGKVEESKETILSRIKTTTSMEEAREAHIVIEAVFEELDLKEKIFKDLDSLCSSETILASNTGGLSITEVSSKCKDQQRVIGAHFFSPVPLMKLVELIRGFFTSNKTLEEMKAFILSLGKEPIIIQKDVSCSVINRIWNPCVIEAMKMLDEGVVTAEDIDKGMRLGYGWSMGPLETADMAGLDILYQVLLSHYDDTKNPYFFPPRMLRRLVITGNLGRKTGKGFYDYQKK